MRHYRDSPRVDDQRSLCVPDRSILETFPNPHPLRAYVIEHLAHEFTSLCPKTGHPDNAKIRIRYVADASCLELKGLRQYLEGFRNRGIFYEDVTNIILDDLVACCAPRWMVVKSVWRVRGGIHSVITARYGQPPGAEDPSHAEHLKDPLV
jgi:7-cyano-7-deazaguanine reductase